VTDVCVDTEASLSGDAQPDAVYPAVRDRPKWAAWFRGTAPPGRRAHSWRAIVSTAASRRCLWRRGSGPRV